MFSTLFRANARLAAPSWNSLISSRILPIVSKSPVIFSVQKRYMSKVPITEGEIMRRVLEVLTKEPNLDTSKVTPDAKFQEDLGVDSVVTYNLIFSFEDVFSVSMAEHEAMAVQTVKDAVQLIKEKVDPSIEAMARDCFLHRKYEEAIKLFNEALAATDPQSKKYYTLLEDRAGTYISMNKPDEALADAEKIIAQNPENDKGYWRKGQALQIMKKYQDALEAFKKAHELKPTHVSEGFVTNAQVLLDGGQPILYIGNHLSPDYAESVE